MLSSPSIARAPFISLKKKRSKQKFNSISVNSHIKTSISVVKSDDDCLEIRFVQTHGTVDSITLNWPFSNESRICTFVVDCQRMELLILTSHSCLMIFDLTPAIASLVTNRVDEKVEIKKDFLRQAICQSARLSLPVMNSESVVPICCKLWTNQRNQRVLCVGFSYGYVCVIDTRSLSGVYFRVSDQDIISLGISMSCVQNNQKSFVTLISCSLNGIVSCTVVDIVSTDGTIDRIVDSPVESLTCLWSLQQSQVISDDPDNLSFIDLCDEFMFNRVLSLSSGYLLPSDNHLLSDFVIPSSFDAETIDTKPKCHFGIYSERSEILHLFAFDLSYFKARNVSNDDSAFSYHIPRNEPLPDKTTPSKTAFQSLLQPISLKLMSHNIVFKTSPISCSLPLNSLLSGLSAAACPCNACCRSNSVDSLPNFRSSVWKCLHIGLTVNYIHLLVASADGCLTLTSVCNLHGNHITSMQLIRGSDGLTVSDENSVRKEFVDFISCRGRMIPEQDIIGSLLMSKMALLRNYRRPRCSDELDDASCRSQLANLMGSLEMERILPPTSFIVVLRAASILFYEKFFMLSDNEPVQECDSVVANLWHLGYSPSLQINLGHPSILALSRITTIDEDAGNKALNICKQLLSALLIGSNNLRCHYDLVLFISRNTDYSVVHWIDYLLDVFHSDETRMKHVIPLIFVSIVSRNFVSEAIGMLSQRAYLLSLSDVKYLLQSGCACKFLRSCNSLDNTSNSDVDSSAKFLSSLKDDVDMAIVMIIMWSLDYRKEHFDDILHLLFRISSANSLTLLLSCLCGHHNFEYDCDLYDIYWKLNCRNQEPETVYQVSHWDAYIVEIAVISLCLIQKLELSRGSEDISCIISSNPIGRLHVVDESFAFREIENGISRLQTTIDPCLCYSLAEFILSASSGTSLIFERNSNRLLHKLAIHFTDSHRLCGRIYEIEYDYASCFSMYLMHVVSFLQNENPILFVRISNILQDIPRLSDNILFDNVTKIKQIATYLLSVLQRISSVSHIIDQNLAVQVTARILRLWRLFMIPTDLLSDILCLSDEDNGRTLDKPNCVRDFLALAYFQNGHAKLYDLQFKASNTLLLARIYFRLKR